ncbi:baseplate J/gp47 family protein [Bradyrhizobium sp. BWC-3-1]|uniref:baseplate assembly protein n=1 Tax=Bradyrhizobium sp. BWC-3-1 TaxID=3080012 RepID=UPI00293E703B|nr:baseplate J/gp47 family protein [Bradyrhizobium sp. BWC-3-1]WOH61904.1 baseplate J/gp47 family protein [Bradyrhizobium sp. BWC-3-1]
MASNFTAVDLSQLPFPDAVEPLDFETILAAMVADLVARDPSFSAMVESDPAHKVLEVAAYREFLLRQRVNESIKATTLAYAIDADLDNIAANYNVQRLLLDAGNPDAIPPVPPTYESDEALRRRVQLAFEGFSTAGPEGAYLFHALSADADVLDAAATSPTPGAVSVAVLSRVDDGVASAELLAAVTAALGDDVRPMTDNVTVQAAVILPYTVVATIKTYSGPDASVVMAAAQAAIEAYTESSMRLGRDITLSAIYHALHQDGVQNVTLTQPTADIVADWNEAARCTAITLTNGGIGE